jgi:hypothetical protein
MVEQPKKVAIVTGASRGIGAAVAERLAKDDFTVVINYAGDAAPAEASCAGCGKIRDFAARMRSARRSISAAARRENVPTQFSPAATVVTLEENYRSTQPILAASNAVIGLARERFTKNLRAQRQSDAKPTLVTVADDFGQVNFVVETVLRNREEGTALKEQAVLFRTSHHSAMLEIELARRNIPFIKFGGLKFVEAAHVKDVLAVLRWTENPTHPPLTHCVHRARVSHGCRRAAGVTTFGC